MARTVIDVSEFNGEINWPNVKADAAMLRLGYRGYGSAGTLRMDARFAANYQGATAAGIPVGVYWLSQAVTAAEARQEARFVRAVLDGLRIAYPVYLDSEYSGAPGNTGRADRISKRTRTDCALAFLDEIRQAGYTPGVYASESWFRSMLELERIKDYTLWVAKYSSVQPDIGTSYDAWQYTDKGRPAGILGNTDMSHFYRDFTAEKKAGKEKPMETRYNTLDEIKTGAKFAHATVRKLVQSGIIQGGSKRDADGNPTDMDLSRDMLRVLVFLDRAGVFDK